MSFAFETTESIPLAADSDGVVRVGRTRITLDTLAEAFQEGATAEEVAQQYPSLSLADVYWVFSYLVRHRAEVAAYLDQRTEERSRIRAENERRFDPKGLRARLLARRA